MVIVIVTAVCIVVSLHEPVISILFSVLFINVSFYLESVQSVSEIPISRTNEECKLYYKNKFTHRLGLDFSINATKNVI